MKKNEEITSLSQEIMVDITNDRLPLHNILLKVSRLSLLLDMPANVTLFTEWAKWAEQNSFTMGSFESSINAAKDRDVAVSSANPTQHVMSPLGNVFERSGIRDEAKKASEFMAHYRTKTYEFASGIYNKWQFANIAES